MGIILKILSKPRNWVIILILLLFAGNVIQTWRANKFEEEAISERNQKNDAIRSANGEREKTAHYYNKYHEQVAVTKTTELSRESALTLKEFEWTKKFEGLNKKYKNLVSASITDISINGDLIELHKINVDSLLTVTDSLNNRLQSSDEHWAFEWKLKDAYNDIYAIVLDTPRFNVKVPLPSVIEWKKRHHVLWFKNWGIGKKEYFMESTSPNKLVKIESQQFYTIRKKK